MNKKLILFLILFIISSIILSLQSTIFDSFNISTEKDIFLEFEVDTSLQYNLFVIDAYNCAAFGKKYSLEYAIAAIYKKDKKTAYPSNIYVSPFKEGGITTSVKEPVATFKPAESTIYIRVRGTSIKSEGIFGLALISSKNKKVSYKISKSIFSDLHKEALNKNNLEEFKLTDGKAIKIIYNIEKDKEYNLTLVDVFNNEIYGTYFTLDGLWFHILDENGNFYTDIYTSPAEDGGITPINLKYSAKFKAKTSILTVFVEPISLVYEGTFGIKLEKNDGVVVKSKSFDYSEPIGYESKIESSFEEEIIEVDTLEISNGSLLIKFNTQIGKTYYIYLADSYNQEVFNSTFNFKDLFFQIFDDKNNLIKGCYSSETTYQDQIGGITILSNEPSASFLSNAITHLIKITSFSSCISGTIGLIIYDSDKNIIPYEVLTK